MKFNRRQIISAVLCACALPALMAQDAARQLDTLIAALQNTGAILATIKDADTAKAAKPQLDPAADALRAAIKAMRDTRMDKNNATHAAAMDQKKNALMDAQSKYTNALNAVRTNPAAEKEVRAIIAKLMSKQ